MNLTYILSLLLYIMCTNFSDVANVMITKISTCNIRFYGLKAHPYDCFPRG